MRTGPSIGYVGIAVVIRGLFSRRAMRATGDGRRGAQCVCGGTERTTLVMAWRTAATYVDASCCPMPRCI